MITRDLFIGAKNKKKKWTMLTAYDAPTAELLEGAGVDLILVGDSLGMVLLGYPSTVSVTMDEMIHHAKAVRRGAPNSWVIGDLPLNGVVGGPKQALVSAKRFIEEAGLDAVKLEWGTNALKTTELLIKNRIAVMGHVGLTPQSVRNHAGFKVRGQKAADALEIFKAAKAFETRETFAVLLECVPSTVARTITEALEIPTIGIGAGPHCDGQVLVFHDLVGVFKKFTPRFVKRYANLDPLMRKAVKSFIEEVRIGKFPKKEHTFLMDEAEKAKFMSEAPKERKAAK